MVTQIHLNSLRQSYTVRLLDLPKQAEIRCKTCSSHKDMKFHAENEFSLFLPVTPEGFMSWVGINKIGTEFNFFF